MRKYQPIWNILKVKRKVSLAVSPGMHRRVVKAVTKEKNSDVAFKLECQLEDKTYRLDTTITGNMITFKLVLSRSSV